jgi:hypothetical protein
LAEKNTYLILVVVLCPVVPWYLITASITADGFNYKPGIGYAQLALQSNLGFLVNNLGYFGLILAIAGAWYAWTVRKAMAAQWECAAACLALILATLLFQSIAPAALEERYIAPALPALIILAAIGICACKVWIGPVHARGLQFAMTSVVILAAIYPSLLFVAQSHAKGNLRLDMAADSVVRDRRPAIWIIDGSPSAEGALIAEVAVRDHDHQIYIVRSSQLLAVSDFMGRGYRLKFPDPAAVIQQVQALGAQGVILVDQANQAQFEHSRQLRTALNLPQSGYTKSMIADHFRVPGQTDMYEATAPKMPNYELLREFNFPAKAKAFGAQSQH